MGGGSYAPAIYAPPTEAEVVEVVATRRNAIACVSRPYAEQAGSRVRMLRVSQADGLPYVALDRETLLTQHLPAPSLRFRSRHRPTRGAAANFINFVSGMDGQRIVARHGYAPAAVPIEIIRTAEEVP